MSSPDQELSAEEEIRRAARRIREAEAPESEAPESLAPESELDTSTASYKGTLRGPTLMDRLKRRLEVIIIGAVTGALGTGGRVAFEASRPAPSVVEVRELRKLVEEEKKAREIWEAKADEKVKNYLEASDAKFKQLREDVYRDYRDMGTRMNDVEGWKAQKVREEAFKARYVQ